MTDIPHFQIPFRWEKDFHASVNEQDALDDVTDCVKAIVLTHKGERTELIDFGINDPTFRQLDDVEKDLILTDIRTWEPRVQPMMEEGWDLASLTEVFRITVKEYMQDD
jgi:phage baseplate assembly protein W